MYNLFISGGPDTWNGNPFILEISRCVREYTDSYLTDQYGDFTEEQIHSLKKFPCIFGYEPACKKDPHYGFITNVSVFDDQVTVDYEIIKLDKFLTFSQLKGLEFELEILEREMKRTHWALKNVSLTDEVKRAGINLPD